MKDKLKKFIKKYQDYILLSLILIFGAFLRLYKLSSSNMWVDETISSLASSKILLHGIPVFDSGIFYGRALLFHYFQAFSMLLFGVNDFSARLISVLFGLATILLAYFIGKEFSKTSGFLAALFTAIIYLEVVYSRQARFYQMFQFLFFLTIYLAYKARADKKYAFFSIISFLLLVQTQKEGLILAPLLLYVYIKELKDIKLSFVLIILSLYFASGLLGITSLNTSLATNYASEYSSGLFDGLRFFLLLGIAGIPLSFKYNKRLLLFLALPCMGLVLGLLFVKLFASRYLYSIVLLIIILSANLISYLSKNHRLLFVIILIAILIYPSNLFFDRGYLTLVAPEDINHYTTTEPVLEYKSISSNTFSLIENSTLVVLWSPGAEWYLKKPDYVIPFSLSGLNSGYATSNNRDVYTGAEIFNNQTDNFILIEDIFSYLKLNETERNNLEDIKSNCNVLEESRTLRVTNCSLKKTL